MTINYLDSKRISLLEADRTLIQGYDGGVNNSGGGSPYVAAGGGGAGSIGGIVNAGSNTNSGNGGSGRSSSITGTATYYSGGGAGGLFTGTGTAGTGGSGIGGNGGKDGSGLTAGTASTGSGGGGYGNTSGSGANGGSGIVILRFTTSGNGYGQAGGTVDSSTVAGQTIITYTATSGTTFTPTSAFDVQYLVVAGGGAGSNYGAGGAGGYRTDTGHAVTAQAYTITVGAGGTGAVTGTAGSDSIFSTITSLGGGRGGTSNTGVGGNGGSGGSGGYAALSGTGTSSDTTPTNVQDNSILVEKDTGKRYWFNGTTWSTGVPDSILDLYAWYDASDLTTITKTADRVSSWTNKEGTTARDLNQGTSGSQPLWLSANKNGLDTIDFVGSRYIRTDSALTTISAAQLTIFIVLKIPANGVTINHSMSNIDTAGGQFHPFYHEDNNTIRISNTSGGAYVIDSPPSALAWTYVTVSQNGTSGFVRTDGTLETTVPTSPTGTARDFRGLSVGRYEAIAGSYWNEEIGEIIIYDRILTSTEIDTIESYLKSKWGL